MRKYETTATECLERAQETCLRAMMMALATLALCLLKPFKSRYLYLTMIFELPIIDSQWAFFKFWNQSDWFLRLCIFLRQETSNEGSNIPGLNPQILCQALHL